MLLSRGSTFGHVIRAFAHARHGAGTPLLAPTYSYDVHGDTCAPDEAKAEPSVANKWLLRACGLSVDDPALHRRPLAKPPPHAPPHNA